VWGGNFLPVFYPEHAESPTKRGTKDGGPSRGQMPIVVVLEKEGEEDEGYTLFQMYTSTLEMPAEFAAFSNFLPVFYPPDIRSGRRGLSGIFWILGWSETLTRGLSRSTVPGAPPRRLNDGAGLGQQRRLGTSVTLFPLAQIRWEARRERAHTRSSSAPADALC